MSFTGDRGVVTAFDIIGEPVTFDAFAATDDAIAATEPAALTLFGAGLLALGWTRRRKS